MKPGHDQARCIDDALGTCLREIANAGNPVVHDADVGFVPGRACAINDAPVLDQQVKDSELQHKGQHRC